MSLPAINSDSSAATGVRAKIVDRQIKIVKQSESVIVSRRREELLRQADYMEAQANRLAKMAREMRAMVTHLTIE